MSGLQLSSRLLGRAAWVLLAVLALNSFRLDWELVGRTGSIDFRNRVTGARLLFAGEDAYHYKWLPGAPEAWCDLYANRAHPVTKTTVTPAMLLLTSPVAAFSYPVAQKLWLLLQWVMLAGVWGLWFRHFSNPRKRLLWTAILIGFTYALAWRHHVDRGQYYIGLVFLLSLWITWTIARPNTKPALAGAVAGVLMALRPPLLLFLVPFLWFRRPDQRRGAAIGLAVSLLLPMLVNGGSWSQYAQGMREWSHLYRHNDTTAPGALAYPAQIEGLSLAQLSRYDVSQYADSSIHRLLRALGLSPAPDLLPLAALGLALALWIHRFGGSEDALLLTGIAAWSFTVDFFLPAYRNPYNDVMLLTAIGCLLAAPAMPRFAWIPVAGALGLGRILISVDPGALWVIHLPTLAGLGIAFFGLWPKVAALPRTR